MSSIIDIYHPQDIDIYDACYNIIKNLKLDIRDSQNYSYDSKIGSRLKYKFDYSLFRKDLIIVIGPKNFLKHFSKNSFLYDLCINESSFIISLENHENWEKDFESILLLNLN